MTVTEDVPTAVSAPPEPAAPAPAASGLAAVLGSGFEMNLRQGILLMDSDPIKFVSRPWTAAILTLAASERMRAPPW